MNRLTRTKLEKLLYIHDCRVDQIVDNACSELDAVAYDLTIKPAIEAACKTAAELEINPWKQSTLYELGQQQRAGQTHPLWPTQQQAAAQQGAFGSGLGGLGAAIQLNNPL